MFQPAPFTPRPIQFARQIEHDGWRLKRYDIHLESEPIDEAVFDSGLERALTLLPSPPMTERRPGVGFVICHQGADSHYIVLNWWDNENELFQHIRIRARPDGQWGPGEGRGSFCVWDTQVIWHEREAYVRHVLTRETSIESYLADIAVFKELHGA